jgi:hypothetical protein
VLLKPSIGLKNHHPHQHRTEADSIPFVKGPTDTPVNRPVRVGTRYRETRLMHGKGQQAELEIVEFEAARKYAMQNVTEGIETVYRYNFQPERDGTRIDLICELKASGIKKLMLPLVAAILKKEDGDHLQRMTKVLEE